MVVYITIFGDFKNHDIFKNIPGHIEIRIMESVGKIGEKNIKIFYEEKNYEEREIAELICEILVQNKCKIISDGYPMKTIKFTPHHKHEIMEIITTDNFSEMIVQKNKHLLELINNPQIIIEKSDGSFFFIKKTINYEEKKEIIIFKKDRYILEYVD